MNYNFKTPNTIKLTVLVDDSTSPSYTITLRENTPNLAAIRKHLEGLTDQTLRITNFSIEDHECGFREEEHHKYSVTVKTKLGEKTRKHKKLDE